MKALNPHLLGVDCKSHVRHLKYDHAARRQGTKERRRANGTRWPQCGFTRPVANVTVIGVRRQDCGGVQPNGVTVAGGSRRIGALGRNGLHRSRRRWSTSAFCVVIADFCARRTAFACANGGRLSVSGNAHGRRGSATKGTVSGVCTGGLRSGSTQRAAAAQSRARYVRAGVVGATREGGIGHRQVKGRTRPTRVFTTPEFSAFAITRRQRCARPIRVASTSADVLKFAVLSTSRSLSSPSSAARMPSFNPFRHDVAIV